MCHLSGTGSTTLKAANIKQENTKMENTVVSYERVGTGRYLVTATVGKRILEGYWCDDVDAAIKRQIQLSKKYA